MAEVRDTTRKDLVPRKGRDQLVRHPVCVVILRSIARHIDQRNHRNRVNGADLASSENVVANAPGIERHQRSHH